MNDPYRAIGDIHVLPSSEAAPGHGVLPVNAFLVGDRAAVLVDTGLPTDQERFLESLWSLVDPDELSAVFLTHEDADHAGNLAAVLDAAPRARLVTNYVTLGKLQEAWSPPLDRVTVVNPGQSVRGPGRDLVVLRPPLYDAPGTVGLHDPATAAVLTVDAFGAYLPELVADLRDVDEEEARSGFFDFNRVNHPWAALVDPAKFDRALAELRDIRPGLLLSSHGVPAPGRTEALLEAMDALPGMEPFVPPDQDGFEQLRPEMEGS